MEHHYLLVDEILILILMEISLMVKLMIFQHSTEPLLHPKSTNYTILVKPPTSGQPEKPLQPSTQAQRQPLPIGVM